MKSRKWRRLFKEGTLLVAHMEAYEVAKVKGGGQVSTKDLDQIIDQCVDRVVLPNGKVDLKIHESAPVFKEFSRRTKRGVNGQYRDGKILEVARRECGGQE